MAKLIIIEGNNKGAVYELKKVNTLGKEKDNSIILNDSKIDKHHAKIEWTPDGYVIYSLSKEKKIKINGYKIYKSYLKHGDIINIGGIISIYLEKKEDFGDFARSTIIPIVNEPIISFLEMQSNIHILKSVNPVDYIFQEKGKLKTLIDITNAINETNNIEILLNKILNIILKQLPAVKGSIVIFEVNKKGKIKYKVQNFSKDSPTTTKKFQNISKKISKKIILGKTSLVYIGKEYISINVPLRAYKEILGYLKLEFDKKYKFQEQDLLFLQKIALQISLAIKNLYIYNDTLKYREGLITLEKLSQSFYKYLDSNLIIQEVVKAIKKIFKCENITLFLLDKFNSDYLKVEYSTINLSYDKIKIPLKGTIIGKVFKKEKPIIIKKPSNLFQKYEYLKIFANSLKPCIIVPIKSISYECSLKKKSIGVILINKNNNEESFSLLEKNLLSLLANQIGTALSNAKLYEKATKDPLTQVLCRAYFFQCLQKEIYNSFQSNIPLSIIMIDIDYFKEINDTYSHQAGDIVLQEIGKILKQAFKQDKAIIGRYGGEEFIISIKHTYEQALKKAEELRKKIFKHTFTIDQDKFLKISISVGVSTLKSDDIVKTLVDRADKCLYIAKNRGRNLVIGEKEL